MESISTKIGCTAQTLNGWVKRYEIDPGLKDGVSTQDRERVKALEREVKELRRANEILRKGLCLFRTGSKALRHCLEQCLICSTAGNRYDPFH